MFMAPDLLKKKTTKKLELLNCVRVNKITKYCALYSLPGISFVKIWKSSSAAGGTNRCFKVSGVLVSIRFSRVFFSPLAMGGKKAVPTSVSSRLPGLRQPRCQAGGTCSCSSDQDITGIRGVRHCFLSVLGTMQWLLYKKSWPSLVEGQESRGTCCPTQWSRAPWSRRWASLNAALAWVLLRGSSLSTVPRGSPTPPSGQQLIPALRFWQVCVVLAVVPFL